MSESTFTGQESHSASNLPAAAAEVRDMDERVSIDAEPAEALTALLETPRQD